MLEALKNVVAGIILEKYVQSILEIQKTTKMCIVKMFEHQY